MRELLDAAAVGVAAMALGSALLALLVTRRWPTALTVLLDLLTAAGLLRLVGPPDWRRVLGAALVIAVRRLVGSGLRRAEASRTIT